jgi:hypothetical protein
LKRNIVYYLFREPKLILNGAMASIHFYSIVQCIWFNHFLALKIMKFENVALKNVIHFYVVRAQMCDIHDIRSKSNQK